MRTKSVLTPSGQRATIFCSMLLKRNSEKKERPHLLDIVSVVDDREVDCETAG